jgi:Zn-dependent peptidase ImmA (M78 family)/DNA-binding XRE family transcriptional regulator
MLKERVFSPSRLSVARERRCISQKELALNVGVTPDAICKFESGERNPLPENVARAALILGFPLLWFYASEIELIDAEAISFRSLRSMTAATREKVKGIAEIAAGVVSPAVRSRFKLPELNLPSLGSHSPEEAAKILRDMWKLGQAPISNMVHLLESKGIEVYWLNEPVKDLDAWSFRRDDRAFVALNLFKTAGEREQFDAAHELGHLIMHSPIRRNLTGKEYEKEANQFASAFLMPAEQFRSECPKVPLIDLFLPLKKRWTVSVGAMVYRCKDLGVLSDWHYQLAAKELSVRGWRSGEPNPLPRHESQAHRFVFEKLAAKGVRPTDFSRSLFLPYPEFYEMMPVAQSIEDAGRWAVSSGEIYQPLRLHRT